MSMNCSIINWVKYPACIPVMAYIVTTTHKNTRRLFPRVYVPYLITTGQNPFR